ncbi:MAG: hypothetical protein M1819_004193 [Sarea resinae]|nr:MAG: hypothetical protein M1819_004193 [Sarea resinae]
MSLQQQRRGGPHHPRPYPADWRPHAPADIRETPRDFQAQYPQYSQSTGIARSWEPDDEPLAHVDVKHGPREILVQQPQSTGVVRNLNLEDEAFAHADTKRQLQYAQSSHTTGIARIGKPDDEASAHADIKAHTQESQATNSPHNPITDDGEYFTRKIKRKPPASPGIQAIPRDVEVQHSQAPDPPPRNLSPAREALPARSGDLKPPLSSSIQRAPQENQTPSLSSQSQAQTRPLTPIDKSETFLVKRVTDLSLQSTPGTTASEANSSSGDYFFNGPAPTPTNANTWPVAPEKPKWKSALEEARHFAGGLINHPVESTKHYSILRHSHGLVYYQGPTTSVAITIFSDRALPPDRRLWLQTKGWTGKTGMKLKGLLHTNGSWINVTPATRADASQLPPSDERAWQRDIKKFLQKAPKEVRHHKVRETCIVRIPCEEAGDGYFRIVLTGGDDKTVLCPSPVFRVASTSLSASSIKGASLATLPIEIGVSVLSNIATTATGNAVAPVTQAVQNQIGQYAPSFWTQEAATTAYSASGIDDKLTSANEQYTRAMEVAAKPIADAAAFDRFSRPDIIGPDAGPDAPYPVRIDSRIVRGTGRSTAELGLPTANLSKNPDDLQVRLSGVYFGWASITPAIIRPKTAEKEKSLQAQSQVPVQAQPTGWHPALIYVSPCHYSNPSIVPKPTIKVYLIHSFAGPQTASFVDGKIAVLIMGTLRPHTIPMASSSSSDHETFLQETYRDISITQASLQRPAWRIDAVLDRLANTPRSITDRYVDLRAKQQRLVEKVPIHRLGVRVPSATAKDAFIGAGGLYVPR